MLKRMAGMLHTSFKKQLISIEEAGLAALGRTSICAPLCSIGQSCEGQQVAKNCCNPWNRCRATQESHQQSKYLQQLDKCALSQYSKSPNTYWWKAELGSEGLSQPMTAAPRQAGRFDGPKSEAGLTFAPCQFSAPGLRVSRTAVQGSTPKPLSSPASKQ